MPESGVEADWAALSEHLQGVHATAACKHKGLSARQLRDDSPALEAQQADLLPAAEAAATILLWNQPDVISGQAGAQQGTCKYCAGFAQDGRSAVSTQVCAHSHQHAHCSPTQMLHVPHLHWLVISWLGRFSSGGGGGGGGRRRSVGRRSCCSLSSRRRLRRCRLRAGGRGDHCCCYRLLGGLLLLAGREVCLVAHAAEAVRGGRPARCEGAGVEP